MIIARSLEEVVYNADSIVTVGTFDGVHRVHVAIIEQVVQRARARHARSVIMTFDPHPREIVGRGPVKLLSTLDERLKLMERLGVEYTIVVPFTYEFSRLTSNEFYEGFVVNKVGVKEVIEGSDHMFGRDREANMETLKDLGERFGFRVTAAVTVLYQGDPVSSSKVREALMRGEVEQAEALLDRPYSFSGSVVKGDGRGAQLGFPTANIQPASEKKIVPADGVYFVGIEYHGEQYHGMLNIGVRPTFSPVLHRVVEVHIFDVHGDLYGKELTIFFHKRLRDETKFSSKEELIAQLHHDRNECLKYVEALPSS